MPTPIDYAHDPAPPRPRLPLDPRTLKWLAAILLPTTVVATLLYHVHAHRVRAASLTKFGRSQSSYADGRDARVMIAGNENRKTAAVVVLHFSTPDLRRRKPVLGRVYSTNDPIEGLRSSARVTTAWPPDPVASGVWIDGRRQPVSDQLRVTYISDIYPATDIPVPNAQQPAFLSGATSLDPQLFIQKWITPRLPPPPTTRPGD